MSKESEPPAPATYLCLSTFPLEDRLLLHQLTSGLGGSDNTQFPLDTLDTEVFREISGNDWGPHFPTAKMVHS